MSNVDELVEEVARAIKSAPWSEDMDDDDIRAEEAKAAIKAALNKWHEELLAKHPWNDTDAAISDFLLKRLAELEDK